jgi:hypothetical protein
LSKINLCLAFTVIFLVGVIVGLSANFGWGLPLGTSLTLLIAIFGFGVAIYQSHATRTHNRLLIKPHLIFKSSFANTILEGFYTYTLKVKNVGLGPAVILKYSISLGDELELDGHTIFDALVRDANKHFNANGAAHCVAGFLYPEHALEKGEEKILFEVSFPKEKLSFMQGRELAKQFVKSIDAKIAYSCHYGNLFFASKKTIEPNFLLISSEAE